MKKFKEFSEEGNFAKLSTNGRAGMESCVEVASKQKKNTMNRFQERRNFFAVDSSQRETRWINAQKARIFKFYETSPKIYPEMWHFPRAHRSISSCISPPIGKHRKQFMNFTFNKYTLARIGNLIFRGAHHREALKRSFIKRWPRRNFEPRALYWKIALRDNQNPRETAFTFSLLIPTRAEPNSNLVLILKFPFNSRNSEESISI